MKSFIQLVVSSLCFALCPFFIQAQVSPNHQRIDLSHIRSIKKSQTPPIPTSFDNVNPGVPQAATEQFKLRSENDSLYQINYIDVISELQLRMLADTLDGSNYPLTILHKDVFSANLNLLMEYDALVYQYEGLERTCDTLKALHQREITSLRSLIDLEKERAESLKQSRDQIKTQADILNGQLKESLTIAKDNTKPPFGKQLFRGIVWGAVGFATGVLVMEFAR